MDLAIGMIEKLNKTVGKVVKNQREQDRKSFQIDSSTYKVNLSPYSYQCETPMDAE